MSACTRLTAVPKAFQSFDKDVTFSHSLTSIAANCFYGNNSKDAKVYVHVPDNYVLTVNDETIPATNGKADITSAIGVGQNHAAVTLSCTPDPAHFSVNGDGSYTIHTATGWNVFCDCLDDNDTYNRFSGKTVKLGNDIGTAQDPITRMAGSSKHDFCGTFDGQGYTLTVNISSDSRDYTAPFSYVSTTKADPNDQADSPAAIRNLNVAGTVTATKDYAGGIVGAFWGTLTIENCTSSVAISTDNKHAAGFISCARGSATIRNCLSSVAITGTISGDGTHAGFIGGSSNGVTTTIEGCAFTGSMLGSTTTHCAGFVGYNSGTLTITNSLYAPADDETWVSSDGSATFARGNAPTTTNTYYTRALGTEQGTAAYVYTPATASFVPANVGTEGTGYSVSGITAYATGLKYDGKFYFEKAEVSLADNADNSSNIVNKKVADVTLTGRTLYKDDDWNTLCLPFAVNSFAGTPLEGATVKELDATLSSLAGNTLTLKFKDATSIEAGKPYLVKWAAGTDIMNPIFQDVTINHAPTTVAFTGGSFVGTYSPVNITNENKNSILLLATGNRLGYSKGARTLGSCRAYFDTGATLAREFVVDFGEGETTALTLVNSEKRTVNSDIYDLQGRKLEGKPTQKGMYIVNGKKVVIK